VRPASVDTNMTRAESYRGDHGAAGTAVVSDGPFRGDRHLRALRQVLDRCDSRDGSSQLLLIGGL
jgi:hypothetical protein